MRDRTRVTVLAAVSLLLLGAGAGRHAQGTLASFTDRETVGVHLGAGTWAAARDSGACAGAHARNGEARAAGSAPRGRTGTGCPARDTGTDDARPADPADAIPAGAGDRHSAVDAASPEVVPPSRGEVPTSAPGASATARPSTPPDPPPVAGAPTAPAPTPTATVGAAGS